MTALEYAKNIFSEMNIGDIIMIRDFATKNKKLFIECAKIHIEQTGELEFNSTYEKLRKVK